MYLSTTLGLAAALAGTALAEDFLFHEDFVGPELQRVRSSALGFTAAIATDDEWRAMTATDFAAYKAIAVSESQCRDAEPFAFWADTKAAWGPAVAGNIAVMGTQHTTVQSDGWTAFMDEALRFAVNGSATGLYYTTSCSPDDEAAHTLTDLDVFGAITIVANQRSRNPAHLVLSSAPWALDLTDDVMGDMDLNAGTLFTSFPRDFQPAIITTGVAGLAFADGSNGVPFVITRGGVPLGCGNGAFEPQLREECDPMAPDMADICTPNCRCISADTCPQAALPSSSSMSSYVSTEVILTATGTEYTLASSSADVTLVYPTSVADPTTLEYPTSLADPTTLSTYASPTYPIGYPTTTTVRDPDVCGVEIIYVVDEITTCDPGSTVTYTTTTCTATLQRPIYRTLTEGLPCYPCLLGTPVDEYTTVYITSCPYTTYNPTQTVTVQACHSCPYQTLTTELPGYTPGVCHQCSTYQAEAVAPYPTTTQRYAAVTAGAAARGLEVAAGALGGLVALAAVAL